MKMKFSSLKLQPQEVALKHRYTTQRNTYRETMLLYYARPHVLKLTRRKNKQVLDFSLSITLPLNSVTCIF